MPSYRLVHLTRLSLFSLVLSLSLSHAGEAALIDRQAYKAGDGMSYRYSVSDYFHNVYNFDFAISANDLPPQRRFLNHKHPSIQNELQRRLETLRLQIEGERATDLENQIQRIRQTLPAGVEVKVQQQGKQYNFQFSDSRRSVSAAERRRTTQQLKQQFQQVFAKHNRQNDSYKNEVLKVQAALYQRYFFAYDPAFSAFRPDYRGISNSFVRAMRPVAQAVQQQTPTHAFRGRVHAALTLMQNIPYNTITDRTTSNGSGFLLPWALFMENKGDCDSKATALSAILYNLNPQAAQIMVLMPGHAILGVEMPRKPGDQTYRYKGRSYVLMEAAGPGLFPIGQLDKRTQNYIKRGQVKNVVQLY